MKKSREPFLPIYKRKDGDTKEFKRDAATVDAFLAFLREKPIRSGFINGRKKAKRARHK